jgi:malic enzyme
MLDAQNNDTYKGIDNKIFVKIAENLATHVTDLSVEKILPDMFDKEVSNIVAKTVTD